MSNQELAHGLFMRKLLLARCHDTTILSVMPHRASWYTEFALKKALQAIVVFHPDGVTVWPPLPLRRYI